MNAFSQHEPLSLEQACDRLRGHRIHTDTPVQKKTFLFSRDGRPCFPRSELVALGGKAKSGKTFFTTMLMAAAECGHALDIERIAETPLRVLWIDTEQSEDTTYEILTDRIAPMTGGQVDMQRLVIYNIRGEHWQDRLDLFKAAVFMADPDLILFDGIRDVVADINDYDMAQQVMDQLLTIASESHACIVCVLHQNKAAEDKNLRGALGTELMNKAFEVYECQKNTETKIFTVSQTATRKYDQRKLSFLVSKDGLPKPCLVPDCPDEIEENRDSEERKSRYNPEFMHHGRFDKRKLFVKAMQGGDVQRESTLRMRVMQIGWIRSTGLYENLQREAIAEKVIEPSATIHGETFYKLTDPELVF